jgi:hypothetical protein
MQSSGKITNVNSLKFVTRNTVIAIFFVSLSASKLYDHLAFKIPSPNYEGEWVVGRWAGWQWLAGRPPGWCFWPGCDHQSTPYMKLIDFLLMARSHSCACVCASGSRETRPAIIMCGGANFLITFMHSRIRRDSLLAGG